MKLRTDSNPHLGLVLKSKNSEHFRERVAIDQCPNYILKHWCLPPAAADAAASIIAIRTSSFLFIVGVLMFALFSVVCYVSFDLFTFLLMSTPPLH